MVSVREYRETAVDELSNANRVLVNVSIELCEQYHNNETTSNATLSFLDLLSFTCDFCELRTDVEHIWSTGVCNYPEKVIFHTLVYGFYTLILVLAVLGNILVVYVVCSSKKMQTVTNYFIANLAVGDLCMAIFCVPFSFLSTLILQYWPFGFHLCVIVNYLQAVSVFVSAYTLVALSLDRYSAIIYPLRVRLPRHQAKIIIVVVWTLSLVTTFPIAYFSDLMQPPMNFYRVNNLMVCQEDWGKFRQGAGAGYSATLMLLQYFLPITVLLFTYIRIAIEIWGKRQLGENRAKSDRLARSKRKTIEMMITCVTTYSFAWLPLNIYNILRDLPGVLEDLTDDVHFKLFFAVHWLAMAHTCCNPIIYFWMNHKFRIAYLKVFSCCCKNNHRVMRYVSPPSPFFSSVHDRREVYPMRSLGIAPRPPRTINLSCQQSCYCFCCGVKTPPDSPSYECELSRTR